MESLKAADRAKYVRTELKAMFPSVKFSVKSQTYSLGSNVTVSWTNGPTEESVQNVIDCLAEDMKTLYDMALNTQYNMITVTRKISDDVWTAIRNEVVAEMEDVNDPRVTESWVIERRVSRIVEERSFN